jgi:hypothetical protein
VLLAVAILGFVAIVIVLADIFAAIIEPRTVDRPLNLTTIYYTIVWKTTRAFVRFVDGTPGRREAILGKFGPLSLLGLIVLWVSLLIFGFAAIQFGLETPLSLDKETGFGPYVYLSAETFFTLGYGDMTAQSGLGRAISMIEAGTGFGMLAAVIGYLPVLYQSFSRREQSALLLDARAGSPPTGGELLLSHAGEDPRSFERLLDEFEKWAAALLESFLSYPMLAHYRSQHEKLSWLACLTAVLDACAFIQVAYEAESPERRALKRQAALTFAMGRHLAVDLAYILDAEPMDLPGDRFPPADWERLAAALAARGERVCSGACGDLAGFRAQYEPYLYGLSQGLLLPMPGWLPEGERHDAWQTTAWDSTRHF